MKTTFGSAESIPASLSEWKTTGGIEFVFSMADELLAHGIDPSLVELAMEADKKAQAELSLVLLGLIIDRDKRRRQGETHSVSRKKVISDTFVHYLIAACLDALDWNHLEMTPDLIVLIKHQLGPISSRYEVEEEKRQKKDEAFWIALQLAANGQMPSYRKIAKAMGIRETTVLRWFPDNSFISMAKNMVGKIIGVAPSVSLEPSKRRKLFRERCERAESSNGD